jgi:hypothetical protein
VAISRPVPKKAGKKWQNIVHVQWVLQLSNKAKGILAKTIRLSPSTETQSFNGDLAPPARMSQLFERPKAALKVYHSRRWLLRAVAVVNDPWRCKNLLLRCLICKGLTSVGHCMSAPPPDRTAALAACRRGAKKIHKLET